VQEVLLRHDFNSRGTSQMDPFGIAWGVPMKSAVWAICEHLAEVQAILEAHLESGIYSRDEIPRLINDILSGEGLREAMDAVGYPGPCTKRH